VERGLFIAVRPASRPNCTRTLPQRSPRRYRSHYVRCSANSEVSTAPRHSQMLPRASRKRPRLATMALRTAFDYSSRCAKCIVAVTMLGRELGSVTDEIRAVLAVNRIGDVVNEVLMHLQSGAGKDAPPSRYCRLARAVFAVSPKLPIRSKRPACFFLLAMA
jgi:hypothetical protein